MVCQRGLGIVIAVLACLTSQVQAVNTTDVVARFLEPATTVDRFAEQIYNQHAHVVKRSREQAAEFLEMLAGIEPLTMAVDSTQAFANIGYGQYAAGVTLHTSDGEVLRLNTTVNGSNDIQELYQQGVSFVVKAELVDVPMSLLQQALEQRFTTDITVHAYVSPGGAQALKVFGDGRVTGCQPWCV